MKWKTLVGSRDGYDRFPALAGEFVAAGSRRRVAARGSVGRGRTRGQVCFPPTPGIRWIGAIRISLPGLLVGEWVKQNRGSA